MESMIIQKRIAAREAAETLIAMAEEDLEGECQGYRDAFWREIAKKRAAGLAPKPPPAATGAAMSDEDAERFERKEIGFGTHAGTTFGEVPTGYLLWLAGQNAELAAYLRSGPGQRRQDEA